MHFFPSSCLAGMWYMMRQCCPPQQCSQPPQSFYRKLIGSCHWCVKLLCAGHRRQLDYSVSVFSILVQVPSALLSSSNAAVVFQKRLHVKVSNSKFITKLIFSLCGVQNEWLLLHTVYSMWTENKASCFDPKFTELIPHGFLRPVTTQRQAGALPKGLWGLAFHSECWGCMKVP